MVPCIILSVLTQCAPGPSLTCPADVNGDHQVNIDDLLGVINGWGSPGCNIDGLLAVVNGWGPCLPLAYTQVPRFACNNPTLFGDIFFGEHSQLTVALEIGDSTSDPMGSPGTHFQAHRRHIWHQHFGHTPATAFTRSAQAMGGAAPGAEWGLMGRPAGIPPNPIVPDEYLPPGMGSPESRSKSFMRPHSFGGEGTSAHLNHRNGNQDTWGGGIIRGFNYVPEGIDIGSPDYASGTMDGGKSIINANPARGGGLRAQILAATDPDSDDSVYWKLFAQENLINFVSEDGQPPLLEGQMFGGAQSLAAPNGTVYVGTTGLFPTLTGPDKLYSLIATSNSILGNPVQILGIRFVSEDTRGLAWETLSYAGFGYHANKLNHTILAERPQCGPVIKAIGPSVIIVRLSLNDYGTVEEIEQAARDLVAFCRTAMNNDEFPIVLEVATDLETPPDDWDRYAGALYEIFLDTPNILLLNLRLIYEQNLGWGTGSDRAYYLETTPGEGIHHTPLAARLMAELEYQELRNNLVGPGPTRWYRHPGPTATDCRDAYIGNAILANVNTGNIPSVSLGFGTSLTTRPIYEIDVDTIPGGAQIVAASLAFTQMCGTPANSASAYSVYGGLADCNLDGSGLTGPTWIHKDSPNGNSPWATPGGDFDARTTLFTDMLRMTPGMVVWSGDAFEAYWQSVVQQASDRTVRFIAKRDDESGVGAAMVLHSKERTAVDEQPIISLLYVPSDVGDSAKLPLD
jgi:hypothetical protein